jgi:hypothetical protein
MSRIDGKLKFFFSFAKWENKQPGIQKIVPLESHSKSALQFLETGVVWLVQFHPFPKAPRSHQSFRLAFAVTSST